MSKRHFFVLAVLVLLFSATARAQTPSPGAKWGNGVLFFGALGLFDLDRHSRDPAVDFGAGFDFRLGAQLAGSITAGFLANVGNNDAFDDRSGILSAGLKYRLRKEADDGPFISGGGTVVGGTGTTRGLAFAGVGYSHWYGRKLTGWQVEVRNHFNGNFDFLEVRLALNVR